MQHYLESTGASQSGAPTTLHLEDLARLAAGGDAAAVASLDRMGRYLGSGLANLATVLAPDVIAVVGEVTAIWDRVGPIVADIMAAPALPNISTRVVATDPKAQPRLRGAVTLVVQQHFGAPVVA